MVVAGNSEYFIEYPENIHLFGLSFSTTLPTGTAWSGEVSYRPNAPVQLNTTDILFAGLSSEAPGFYQFNLRLPSTLADGNVPVSMRVGAVETQPGVVIPIRR